MHSQNGGAGRLNNNLKFSAGYYVMELIQSHLRQLNKNKVAESLDFTGVMPLFMFKRMLYGNTTLKFF